MSAPPKNAPCRRRRRPRAGLSKAIIKSSKDQAAIIPFTGSAFLEQGLTRDVLSIYRALERVEVATAGLSWLGPADQRHRFRSGNEGDPPEGSTAIWDAIALTASEVLARIREGQTSAPDVADQFGASRAIRTSLRINDAARSFS